HLPIMKIAIETIQNLRWQDILDILLVAFIFYRLILIIKGTRTFQMLAGLAMLLLVLIVSKWIELYTIDWIFTKLWSQIVIVLIILFQPEIRRALAQIGKNPFSNITPMEEFKTLEEIVKASVSLANKKIGGIIVLEREIDLREIVEMGIQLDAKVSKEILNIIFLPQSPIHDGAVIIKGNRIVAAGCFLPLSLSPDISKIFGTRHRAAMGITEETDAVAIALSEEMGTISVIIGGKMTREVDAATLRRILTKIFIKEMKKDGLPIIQRLRDLFPGRIAK
ncbi:MAG: diadenylate cyclase CdaA, partial [Nitrospirota bacterium]